MAALSDDITWEELQIIMEREWLKGLTSSHYSSNEESCRWILVWEDLQFGRNLQKASALESVWSIIQEDGLKGLPLHGCTGNQQKNWRFIRKTTWNRHDELERGWFFFLQLKLEIDDFVKIDKELVCVLDRNPFQISIHKDWGRSLDKAERGALNFFC